MFNPLYVAMVRAGEAGGVLEDSLERISDQLEKDDLLRRQVKSAMAYLIVVFTFAALVLIGMIAFIVPVFVGVFEDFGGELPLITRFTVGLSNAVTGQWYILIAVAIGSVIGFRKWKSLPGAAPVGPVPPAHPVQHRQDRPEDRPRALVAHVLRAYGAGVPIMQAIEVTGQTAGNAVVDRAMTAVIESVKSGGSIAAPSRTPRSSRPWSPR